jgi:glycosyltransferase involved in cell wall biosynthesis
MTIYLDISAAVHRRAGLGRYAENLARALAPLLPDDLALFYNQEAGIEPLAGLEHLPARTVSLGYKPWRMLVWAGQLGRVGFNRLVPGATLLHATEHLLLPLRGVPTVLTVHDLIFRHLPQYHKRLNRWYLNLALPHYCQRANHIIAVSEYTRQDLITSYGLSPKKITVILEAADPRFMPQTEASIKTMRAQYGLPERYLLFVSTLEPRKNLTRLLAAWEPLYAASDAPPLVIAGKRGWLYDEFFAALERSPSKSGVLLPGYIADEDLPALYAGAEVFLFPSLYEGFGLPVLEAMACGTPVICSNSSSLPEVAGDAAVLVDPYDTEALRASLSQVLQSSSLQETMRIEGLAQAARFSWDRTARETLSVYRKTGGS